MMALEGSAAVGNRIAASRKARRMTQAQLADAAAISISLLQKVEQGSRAATPGVIASIARALDIAEGQLSGDPYLETTRVHDAIPLIRHAMDSYDLPEDGPLLALIELQAATRQATAYRLGSQYSRLAATLPDLLRDLTRAAYSCSGHEREEAYGLLAMAYRAADAIADKHGFIDLSARAIELIRWAAAQAGDPLMQGMAAYVRTELFLTSRRPGVGLQTLDGAIAAIDAGASRAASAIHGSLHMRAAVTAATAGLTEPTASHLAEAREMAERVPDGVYYGTAFGPSSFRIHEIAAAAELGDASTVLKLAQAWRPPPTVPAERRSHYYIELARAQLWAGQRSSSLSSLRAAKKIAPQHARCNAVVRETVTVLMRIQRHPPEPLMSFAAWTGIG